MLPKYLLLIAAFTLVGPARAISFNVTDFTFGSANNVVMRGTAGSPSYAGTAGEFSAESSSALAANDGLSEPLALRSAAAAAAPTSFMAWCAELTQDFTFGVTYTYSEQSGTSYFGARTRADLSRLFTAAQGFVVDAGTSAAMQAGIWEIIYERGTAYGFASGTFLGAPALAADLGAFATVNGYLANLSSYNADYQIRVLTNPERQDFLVATIPEPETWALLVAGLAALGVVKRRRKG